MLKDVADEAEKALIMEAVLRSQTQAYYGPRNAGHFGLALGSYAHFTSPIRRYADLLVHRALVDAYRARAARAQRRRCRRHSGLSDRDRADLARVSDAISQAERRAMEAERETIDRYVAAWLSAGWAKCSRPGSPGCRSFGFFATIIGLGGDGLVPVSTLGDERFGYDEAAQVLVGEQSGTTLCHRAIGCGLQAGRSQSADRRAEVRAGGQRRPAIEPRGANAARGTSVLKHKGKHLAGQRGRPGQYPASGAKQSAELAQLSRSICRIARVAPGMM